MERRPGMHADGGGLYLRVTNTGAKSWIFRFQIDGRRRDLGLGSLETFSLAAARERANKARQLAADGIDPIEAKATRIAAARAGEARTVKFRECAEAYIKAHRAGWRSPVHAKQWPASLETYVYPILGSLAVAAIDLPLVLRVIEPIWSTKPETASRVRGRIEAILDWATVRGYRQGENPARWRGHLESLLPSKTKVRAVEHHAALPYSEIAAFMVELRRQEGTGARALELSILTAARTGEVIGARWTEIDLAEKLWTVPAARMKGGKEHRVPLSDAAINVIETMATIRQGDFVFPGTGPDRGLGRMAMLDTLGRMGRAALTVHGFRSSFRDWCAEQTAFPTEVAELALAHQVGSKVEQAYMRSDLFQKRRQLAEAWATFCASPLASGRVVPIRQPVRGK